MIEVTSLSAIEHILRHKPERIKRLFIPGGARGREGDLIGLARAANVPVDKSPVSSGRKGNDGGAKALLDPFEYQELGEFIASVAALPRAIVLALDHIQDPQNFGAICRTAEGLGASGILLPKDRSVVVSPGVYAASVGAVETVPIVSAGNLGEGLRKMKEAGFWILGASLSKEAKPPWETPDFEKIVVVSGAELEGLSPTIEKQCDWHVRIPLDGLVQSLNVSVATALLIYELTRRTRVG